MKAISLHQPHASFIAHGYKPFESRGWNTSYRGTLLIHAAKRPMTLMDRDLALEIFGSEVNDYMPFPMGAFVCIVDLVDVYEALTMPQTQFQRSNGLGDFTIGRFAWKLEHCVRFSDPIPARGRQSFWNYPIGWGDGGTRVIQRWLKV